MSLVDKAKQYSTAKYTLVIIDTVFSLIILFFSLSLGYSKILAAAIYNSSLHGYLIIPSYLLAAYCVYYILVFPLNFYSSYILEHRFSLSKQKIGSWLFDQLKTMAISYAISLILLEFFYFVLKYSPGTWWLVVSIFWIFLSLILAKLMPVIIIPLFFKYKKLNDEVLKEKIINLAKIMKVNPGPARRGGVDVFEIDFSKKTLKGNAAFVGIGNTRRVILADTLKDKYTHEEIEIILAHEFAHYRLRHLLKLVLISSLFTVLTFYIIFKTNNYFLGLFSLGSLSDIASLPLIFIYLFIFNILIQPLENYISRIFEKNADILAIKNTGLKEAFISTMDKLASQNLADRKPHPLIKFFFFNHPPIDERINMAKRF